MSKRLLLIVILFLPAALQAQQAAVALRDTVLRAEPHSDATKVTRIKAKTTLRILQRRGGWYQAEDEKKHTGWLRMSHIRLREQSPAASGGSEGGGLAQTINFLSSGRSGASGVTVATGIRGLDSADVSNAKPDRKAVEKLDSYKVSTANAEKFAANGKLQEKKLRYFKGPD